MPRPSLHDADGGPLFLPGNDKVYLTQTKDGEPAFGRKKPDRLLQGFGFDILSQSLGIPSRMDFEKQPRPLSIRSQSSGIITAPATPRLQGRGAQRLDASSRGCTFEDKDVDVDINSRVTARKTSSTRACSTPPEAVAQRDNSGASRSCQDVHHEMRPPFLAPQGFKLPPPPPPPNTAGWYGHPVMNSSPLFLPMGYHPTTYGPAHLPRHPSIVPATPHDAPNWANSQYHMETQYFGPPGFSPSQTSPVSIQPYRQHFSHPLSQCFPSVQAIPGVRSANILPPPPPPPPPPPQPNWFHAHEIAEVRSKASRQDTKQMNEKDRKIVDEKQYLRRRIHHVHVCAGCGKKRSRRYQNTYPLKRGEIPEPDYCSRCIRDAIYTDPGLANHSKEALVPGLSTDEGRVIANGKYAYKQSRHGPRWFKKSKQFGPFSRIFSREANSRAYLRLPRSIAAVEESRSGDSSLTSDPIVNHLTSRAPRFPVCRNDEKTNDRTEQEEPEVPALPRENSPGEEYPKVKCNSPLVPLVAMPKKLKNGVGKVPSTSSKHSTPVRHHRTRVSQMQPVIANPSPPGTSGILSRAIHEKCSDSGLKTKHVASLSHPAGTQMRSESFSRLPVNRSSTAPRQRHAHIATNDVARTSQAPVSNSASSADTQGDAHNYHKQPSQTRFPKIPVVAASGMGSERCKDKRLGKPDSDCRHDDSYVSSNHSPEISTGGIEGLLPSADSANFQQRSTSIESPEISHEHGRMLHWDEPVTPKDPPYADASGSSCVINDSWTEIRSDLEWEAEELAERDLAAAGKLLTSTESSWGGSTTSSFPMSSFLTKSNISIVSCESDTDCSDSNFVSSSGDGYPVEGTAGSNEGKPAERIEFSSENDRRQKTVASCPTSEVFVSYSGYLNGDLARASGCWKNNPYNKQDNDNGDYNDDDADNLPSPVGSSLIAHTGHSADDLRSGGVQKSLSVTNDGNRFSRFMRLSPT
ncbi:hypothetical protein F5Y19DRAFT_475350 [Xylariaceae sp. FL1651]|nr:hypothetical protein F5Y19DRAFT_475350 [Xylariaceae sp. FL1651]